jgi:hypothetical protein
LLPLHRFPLKVPVIVSAPTVAVPLPVLPQPAPPLPTLKFEAESGAGHDAGDRTAAAVRTDNRQLTANLCSGLLQLQTQPIGAALLVERHIATP